MIWNLESLNEDGKKVHLIIQEPGDMQEIEFPSPITMTEKINILKNYQLIMEMMKNLKLTKIEFTRT